MNAGRRAAYVLATAAAIVAATPTLASAKSQMGEDKVVLVDAFEGEQEMRAWHAKPDPLKQYARAPLCNVNSEHLSPGIDGRCGPPDGTVQVPYCDGETPVQPLWVRTRPSPTSDDWSLWHMRSGWACPDDLLPTLTERDLRRLTIEPLTAHRQPAGAETLVNKALIVYAEPEHRTFRTSLLDYGIDVDVYPVEYTWDFGDGETLTTVDPGSPYPSFDVTHTYAAEFTGARIALTTTWKGKYRVGEDPKRRWLDIEGTAFTMTTFDPFDVVELRSRLVG